MSADGIRFDSETLIFSVDVTKSRTKVHSSNVGVDAEGVVNGSVSGWDHFGI